MGLHDTVGAGGGLENNKHFVSLQPDTERGPERQCRINKQRSQIALVKDVPLVVYLHAMDEFP